MEQSRNGIVLDQSKMPGARRKNVEIKYKKDNQRRIV